VSQPHRSFGRSPETSERRTRRAWWIFAGSFFVLGLISVFRFAIDPSPTDVLVVVLMVIIRRRLPGKPIPGERRAWFRVVGVSAGLFVLLTVLWRFAPAASGRFQEAAWLAAVIIGSTAAYVSCNAALGSDEVRLARGALAGRWRRSSLRREKRR